MEIEAVQELMAACHEEMCIRDRFVPSLCKGREPPLSAFAPATPNTRM